MCAPAIAEVADFDLLEEQVRALLSGEPDFIANAANFAAFIYHALPQVNWAGFYLPVPGGLVLGPFAGKPAATRIPSDRGVCGRAFAESRTLVVDDVNAFPGHIACDPASRSEMVVPLLVEGSACGVFDLDSPQPARFAQADRSGVERLVATFVECSPPPAGYAEHRSRSDAT